MPDDDLVIRRAERRDLATMGRLGGTLVREHFRYDPRRFMAPADGVDEGYAWFLGTELDDPKVVLLVAERGGAVVGYAYAGLEPQSWKELREAAGFVHDVVVDEAARGRGVGAALMEAAAAWLEAQGAPRIMLWTAEMNGPAQRLFARLGFRRTMVEMTREARGG